MQWERISLSVRHVRPRCVFATQILMNFICLLSATRSGATKRVRGMLLMSGKQFSLDSRIDLAEAVEEEEQHQDITELPEEDKGCHSTHSVSVAYIAHNSHTPTY